MKDDSQEVDATKRVHGVPPVAPTSQLVSEILDHILALAKNQVVDLYRSPVSANYIRLPHTEPKQAVPIRSSRVRAWIARESDFRFRSVLMDREIDRILNVVDGEAWEAGRDDCIEPSFMRHVEREPIVGVIISSMEDHDSHSDYLEQLFAKVIETAKQRYKASSSTADANSASNSPPVHRLGVIRTRATQVLQWLTNRLVPQHNTGGW
jgi:hypothetical protein